MYEEGAGCGVTGEGVRGRDRYCVRDEGVRGRDGYCVRNEGVRGRDGVL